MKDLCGKCDKELLSFINFKGKEKKGCFACDLNVIKDELTGLWFEATLDQLKVVERKIVEILRKQKD